MISMPHRMKGYSYVKVRMIYSTHLNVVDMGHKLAHTWMRFYVV